jgi:uncharacterized protein YigE (DUF2233 family)
MLTLAAMLAVFAPGGSSASAAEPACGNLEFEGTRHIVCSFDAASPDLRLHWQDAEGNPYRSFSALASALRSEGRELRFAMNAGMYDTDFRPMGLYVESGTELRRTNSVTPDDLGTPVPNFYKQPNGIFYLGGDGAGILPTESFMAARPTAEFATQSGPMLVIAGELNAIFIEGSRDRTRRSGVGVCDDGQVRFAISEDSVNFHDFARLFRDRLACPNALFLDGGRGAGIYDPQLGRNDFSWHGGYGPMVGFAE